MSGNEPSRQARLRALQKAEDDRELCNMLSAFKQAGELMDSVGNEAAEFTPEQLDICRQGAINRLV